MSREKRPVVLVFVGHYLPGFKAGGILRSVENMVNHLHGEFEFMIVTRDRDLGDASPYPGIRPREWHQWGNARVFYLEPRDESTAHLRQIVSQTAHDLIYLNSFFEPLTVKLLWNRTHGRLGRAPILLSPRGEFAWASLRLKYPKKITFMFFARMIGLYRHVVWHASSVFEADDIARVMRIRRDSIRIALDLPSLLAGVDDGPVEAQIPTTLRGLRVVFLSRISPEKNLDFALRALAKVSAPVSFDIIGPKENAAYVRECEKLLPLLPAHVSARWLDGIPPSQVMATLGQYDLLFFPSGGENYGHVIAEALTIGTPVLISTLTPWRNLEEEGLGWDLSLEYPDAFVRVIDGLASASEKDRFERRMKVKENMRRRLADPAAVNGNRQLLHAALAGAVGRSGVAAD